MRVFGELYQLGYKLRSPTNLRETHVKALVDHWTATKKCPATIQNNLSVLRMFAGWINKKGMIRESQAYVEDKELVRRSVVAKENRSWNARGVDPLEIIEQARKDSIQTQQEADRYVVETLSGLERELKKILQQVENGIKSLQPESEDRK